MDWSHGHNCTIHNGIGRIGFYTGGTKARFRDEDLADEWVKEARRWIAANKERPFFLYFASHDIHVPRMPHERFQGQTPMGFRGDAIVEFDFQVGEIMKALDAHGSRRTPWSFSAPTTGPCWTTATRTARWRS
jgi:arylsulfatase A-like enzyme